MPTDSASMNAPLGKKLKNADKNFSENKANDLRAFQWKIGAKMSKKELFIDFSVEVRS